MVLFSQAMVRGMTDSNIVLDPPVSVVYECLPIQRASAPGFGGTSMRARRSYLVDPASNHTLVLKIKPCMSEYKLLYGETANGSINQL
jgi:hypothetical protein